MLNSAFALVLAGLLVATPGAAQQDELVARAQAGFSAGARAAFAEIVAAARAEGLPLNPIADKALEGQAKGVPQDRVLVVVQQLAGELGRASRIVGRSGARATADIEAVTDAMRRGVPEGALRTLAQGGAEAHLGLAAHTLADLLQVGVPVDVALDVLGAWNTRGERTPQELREIGAAVERRVRQGQPPAEAASAVAASVRAGIGLMRGRGPGGAGPPGLLKLPFDGPPIPPGVGPPTGRGRGRGPPGGASGA